MGRKSDGQYVFERALTSIPLGGSRLGNRMVFVYFFVANLLVGGASVAHESGQQGSPNESTAGRHSLLRPDRISPDTTGASGLAPRKAPIAKGVSKARPPKKSAQPIGKSTGSEPVTNPALNSAPQSSLTTGNVPASVSQATQESAKQKSVVNSSSGSSSTSMFGSAVMSTPAAASIGSATMQAPSAGPSASTGSVVGGSSLPSTKNVQRLLKEMPGLSRIIITPVPVDSVAPPAPPLAPPPPGLPAAQANWFAYHVLNRASFGGTPNQLNTVSHLTAAQADEWANRYLKEQLGLDPALPWPTNLHATSPLPAALPIIDSDTDLLLAQDKADWRVHEDDPSLLVPDLNQLQDHDLIRKMHSRRQLLEKMVYFWDNHFNTDYRSHFAGQYELYENEAFRSQAYGRFIDLLMASGKSSAMMVYLNTDVNVKESPNENYAREVLELHTLGVDDQGRPAGYTQADIVDAAKTLTGWDTPNGPRPGFRFVSSRHSSGSKQVLGQTIAFDGSGPGEGERLLQLAAAHPSTARHIAKKLCEYFVSEVPSSSLITEVSSVFTDSGGDIRKVLIAIFTSPDFRDVRNYRALVKTPLEFVVGIHRNLGVWSSRDPFRTRLTKSGQGLYEMPPPTGYKEKSDQWLTTHVLFNEVGMAFESTIPGFGSTIRYGTDTTGGLTRVWLRNLGLRTEEEILGFLLNLTTDRQVTSTEYQIYLTTLRSAGGTFNLDNSNVETPLDRTLASILANPRYLYQ